MKKNYTAPEAEILCFRPAEELANSVTMDNLLGGENGKPGETDNGTSDIYINLWF